MKKNIAKFVKGKDRILKKMLKTADLKSPVIDTNKKNTASGADSPKVCCVKYQVKLW